MGTLRFYELGFCTSDAHVVRYEDIDRAALDPDGSLAITLRGGSILKLRTSPAGGVVVHATLRWIGNALLRRRIAG